MIVWRDIAGLVAAGVTGLVIWLPAAWVLGKRMRWSLPAVLAGALAFGSLVTGTSAVLARAAHSSLWLAIALSGVSTAVLAAVAFRYRGEGSIDPGWQGLVLGALVGGLALYQRPWFGFTADTFYHLAAARSLIVRNTPLVTDPFHGTSITALDPTSGVFHTWLAMTSRVSGLEVEHVYTGFAAIAAAVVAWAFWALARRVSGSDAIASIVTIGFCALGLWGDMRMAGMPNRFTVAFLCVVLLALLESTIRDRRWPARLVAGTAAAAAMATHFAAAGATLLFVCAAIVVWAVFARRLRGASSGVPSLSWAPAALLIALPLLVMRLGTVATSPMTQNGSEIPSAFISIGAGMVLVRPGEYVGGGPVAFVLMTLVAVVAAYLGYRRKDGVILAAAAFMAVPAVFLCVPPVTTLAATLSAYTVARVALMLKFVPFLAAAWAMGEGFSARREDGAGWLPIALVAAGAAILVAHTFATWQLTQVTFVEVPGRMRNGEAYTVEQSRAADIRNSWGVATLDDARDLFDDAYPMVAATPDTGYYLAGLANVSIVAAPDSHSPLAIETEDGPERREDMHRLFAADATETERRIILDKWDAEYVALSLTTDEEVLAWASMQDQAYLFEPVLESRRLILLRVIR